MEITSTLNGKYDFRQNPMKGRLPGVQEQEGCFGDAVTKVDKREEGIFLGITMVPEEGEEMTYGMTAILLPESTPGKPIVQIISDLRGNRGVYHIDVSKVDPRNASEMEMFALCSYADKTGEGTGSTFGTYHSLKLQKTIAECNGFKGKVDVSLPAWEQFMNEKEDWGDMCRFVLSTFENKNDIKMLDLVSKGKKLLHLFSKYPKGE